MRYLKVDSAIDLSPDGHVVAYTLEDRRKKQKTTDPFIATGAPTGMTGCDIWITYTQTGISKNLTLGIGTSWGPVWSPDGRYLAFYSDRSGIAHLWIWDRKIERLRQVSSAITRSYNADRIQWTRDSKQLLVRLLPERVQLESKRNSNSHPVSVANHRPDEASVRVYQAPETAKQNNASTPETTWIASARADIALIDLAGGQVRRIARGIAPRWVGVSPNGTSIAFATAKPRKAETGYQDYVDLVVATLADGRLRIVARDIPQWYLSSVTWSPEGERLAYSTSGAAAEGRVFVVAADGSEIKEVAKGNHPAFKNLYLPPLWDQTGKYLYTLGEGSLWQLSLAEDSAVLVAKIPQKSIIYLIPTEDRSKIWSPEGGECAVTVARDNSTGKAGFYRIDLKSREVTPLIENDREYGGLTAIFKMDVSNTSANLVFASQSAQQNEDLWITDATFRQVKQLTNINPQIDPDIMGKQRIIDWTTASGEHHQGLLLLPSNYRAGSQYPLIIFVYTESMIVSNTFGFWEDFFNMQLFATRGYAVLYPDLPIRRGEPMKGIGDIVLSGIDTIIRLGIADQNRVGVMGHSYGGYVALSLIVQSPRFKAAFVSAGFSNIFSFYGIPLREDGTTFGQSMAEGQMGIKGSPWHAREQYLRNSPWFFLDQVETPLLIIQGTGDLTFTPQSDEIFVGLRRLGKTVEYAKYEGEGHYPGVWSAANKLNAAKRMIYWFEKYLKAAAPENTRR